MPPLVQSKPSCYSPLSVLRCPLSVLRSSVPLLGARWLDASRPACSYCLDARVPLPLCVRAAPRRPASRVGAAPRTAQASGRARGVALPRCRSRGRGRSGRLAARVGARVPGAHDEEGRLRGGCALSRAAGRRGGARAPSSPAGCGPCSSGTSTSTSTPSRPRPRATRRTACPTASTRSARCPTAAAGRTRCSSSACATRAGRAGPSRARRSRGSTAGTTRCPTAGSATSSRSGCSATGRWDVMWWQWLALPLLAALALVAGRVFGSVTTRAAPPPVPAHADAVGRAAAASRPRRRSRCCGRSRRPRCSCPGWGCARARTLSCARCSEASRPSVPSGWRGGRWTSGPSSCTSGPGRRTTPRPARCSR